MPRGRKVGEIRRLPDEPDWCEMFLEALALTGNVAAAARLAEVDAAGAYRRRGRDDGFRARWAAVLRAREARASGVRATPPSPSPTPSFVHPPALPDLSDLASPPTIVRPPRHA